MVGEHGRLTGVRERRRATRPPRYILLLLVGLLGALVPAQVVRDESGILADRIVLQLPLLRQPSFIVVEGSRTVTPGQLPPDARLFIDDQEIAPLSTYEIAPDRFRAWLPIDVPDTSRRPVLRIQPAGTGDRFTLGRIEVHRAGVLDVSVLDPKTRKPIPGAVEIVAADGHDLPMFGAAPWSLHRGSAWLLPTGRGRMLVPVATNLRLLAWTHPFRAPARRKIRATSGRGIGVPFVLGPDLRPKGSKLVEAVRPVSFPKKTGAVIDRVFGIDRRSQGRFVVAAERALELTEAFRVRLLDEEAIPTILSDMTGPGGTARGPRIPRTVELSSGHTLHSNGVVILPQLVFRNRRTGNVEGTLRITLPKDVARGRLRLTTSAATLLDLPLKKTGDVPLNLSVPSRTRVVCMFEGTAFTGDPLAGPAPFAVLTLVVP